MYINLLLSLASFILLAIILSKKHKKEPFSEPIYVFWSGGFDSTYRICDLVLNQNKLVQPVYIIGKNIDGDDVSRKNIREEIETMDRLYKQINHNGKLLPVIYFDPTKYYSPSIQRATDWIYKEKGFTRNKNQYSSMLTTCIALNKRIEICSENEPGARFAQYIKRVIEKNKQTPAQLYAKWLRFPLLYTNKKQILKTARKSGWEDILHQTFSCWFPVDGKACGKCKMCRERII
jgi:hypothetical protein